MRPDPVCVKHTGMFIERFERKSRTHQWGKVSQSFEITELAKYLESLSKKNREAIAQKVNIDEKFNRPFIEELIIPIIQSGKLPEDEEILNKLKSLEIEGGIDYFEMRLAQILTNATTVWLK